MSFVGKIVQLIRTIWNQLRPRERLLLSVFFILVSSLAVFQFGVIRNIKKINKSAERIQKLRSDLMELNTLYKEYKYIQWRKKEIKSVGPTVSILTAIDSMIEKAQIKSNVRGINGPSIIAVKGKYKKKTLEIKVESVFANQIVDFIYAVEYSDHSFFIDYCYIRDAYNKPGFFDFNIRISQLTTN